MNPVNDRDLVHAFRHSGKKIRHPDTIDICANGRKRSANLSGCRRLGIEEVNVAGRAVIEDEYHRFGFTRTGRRQGCASPLARSSKSERCGA